MPCSSKARARDFFAERGSKAELCCAVLCCALLFHLLLLYYVKQEQVEQIHDYVKQRGNKGLTKG